METGEEEKELLNAVSLGGAYAFQLEHERTSSSTRPALPLLVCTASEKKGVGLLAVRVFLSTVALVPGWLAVTI